MTWHNLLKQQRNDKVLSYLQLCIYASSVPESKAIFILQENQKQILLCLFNQMFQLIFFNQTMDMSEYIVIIILASTSLFYFLYWKPRRVIQRYTDEFRKQGYKVNCIPFNPFSAPFFQMRARNSKLGDPLKSYKNQFVPYDIIIGNIFTKPAIQILSPEVRKQFIKHEVSFCYEKLPQITNHLARVLGKGILLSEGQNWKRKRRILSKLFTYDFLSSQIPEITKICEECFKQLQQQNKNSLETNGEMQFRLLRLTSRIFSSVILSLFLGNQSLEERIEGELVCHFVQDLVSDTTVRSMQKIPLLLGPKFLNLGLTTIDASINRRKKLFDEWAERYIEQLINKVDKQQSQSSKNLIELLFYENKKGQKAENYSKEQLVDQLKVFFFAGSDTTAHFVQMMVYLTAKDPQVLEKVHKQIQELQLNSTSIKRMKYIQCIQKQVIRYFGPIPLNMARLVKKQHYFSGVKLFKNTIIQFYSISTHYNQDYYSNPFQFNPGRWLQQQKDLDPMCLVGFGMGPRSCIGQQLAWIESKIVFFMFFSRYKKVQVPEKVQMRWKFMHEANDLHIKVQKMKAKESQMM